MHHQAVDDVAPDFAVTARSPDGVVEAIESTADDWFAVGVQFHPEQDRGSKVDLCVFEAFLRGVARRRAVGATAGSAVRCPCPVFGT